MANAVPQMSGGGLGPYAPGEWSDDTQMAVCIAEVSATGADLTGEDALDAIAERFEHWAASGATDIGSQTRAVMDAARLRQGRSSVRLHEAAADLHRRTGHTAGNGALMRTSVVGLGALDDRDRTAAAARAVAELTHADLDAGDSCVLWSRMRSSIGSRRWRDPPAVDDDDTDTGYADGPTVCSPSGHEPSCPPESWRALWTEARACTGKAHAWAPCEPPADRIVPRSLPGGMHGQRLTTEARWTP